MVTLMPNKTQNQEAFDEYVLPHTEILYRTAWSLTRSDSDAQDLVQDTMLRAYRAIDRFDGRYPKAWLLTIMRNANINRVRKKRPDLISNPEVAFERSTDFADEDDPETLVVDPMLSASVEEIFETLPDKYRDVIELVDLNGLSYREASDVMQVPVGTIMSRLHRGRSKIREYLHEAGISTSGGVNQ